MGVRNYADIPRVYLDMDGVLADFEKGAEQHGMDFVHFKRVAGAYLDLPLIAGAVDAVEAIQGLGYDTFGLTKISAANPYSATEKLLWARRHFPSLGDRIIITPDKGAVGTPRDFLVDDHPEWANAHNFPGTVLTFTGDWAEVLRCLQKDMARSA